MSGLLSNSQLNALSALVNKGMTTDALIYDRVIAQTADGVSETWVARSSTVKCWFYTNPSGERLAAALGLAAVADSHRLFFELGTDIELADRVVVAGHRFTVIDTSKENTIQAMLTVSVRSLDG